MNLGFQNEYQISRYINNKKLNELSFILQEMIYKLYGGLEGSETVKCFVDTNKHKYDIVITINTVVKRISIKMGYKNSVHTEGITTFIDFLKENKIPSYLYSKYLQYHYADGTKNGSGSVRISALEYKKRNQVIIDKLNKELNNDELVIKAIERFLLKGKYENKMIDGILWGTLDDFLFFTREEIKEIIMANKNKYSTGPHISTLQIQPLSRNLVRSLGKEKCRFIVQVKWYNIFDDYMFYLKEKYLMNSL